MLWKRFASSRRHRCAISSERSYTGRQRPQRASPEPRKALFLKLAKTRVCVAVAFACFLTGQIRGRFSTDSRQTNTTSKRTKCDSLRCESYLYSLQIRVQIWYNTSIKTAIKCDIRCKIKPCNCRLLLRMTYYAPVAKLAYAADSNSVFSGFNSRLEYHF